MHTISCKKLLMLKPDDIKPSENRRRKNFDRYELQRLSDSIRAIGVIEPLSVRKTADGKYELISGERRLKAAVMAGLRRVPCILHKLPDGDAALFFAVENLQRRNLGLFEEAECIERIIAACGVSQTEAAAKLGMAESTLCDKLSLLSLGTELREKITASSLGERHAKALLRLPEAEREEALNRIIAECMTEKQAKEYVTGLLNPKPPAEDKPEPEQSEKPFRKSAIGDMRLLGNSISKLVNTLKNAGIDASLRKYETDKFIEYKVRIKKESITRDTPQQLKIC